MNTLLVVLASTALAAGAPDTITLKQGETQTLPLADVKRFAIDDPELAFVRIDEKKQLVVRAKKRDGTTTLRLLTGDGQRHDLSLRVGSGKETPDHTITLREGESVELREEGVVRLAISDPEVTDVRAIGGGKLSVKALARGKASVVIWTRGGRTTYQVEVR